MTDEMVWIPTETLQKMLDAVEDSLMRNEYQAIALQEQMYKLQKELRNRGSL